MLVYQRIFAPVPVIPVDVNSNSDMKKPLPGWEGIDGSPKIQVIRFHGSAEEVFAGPSMSKGLLVFYMSLNQI